jgi:hypothetical protein
VVEPGQGRLLVHQCRDPDHAFHEFQDGVALRFAVQGTIEPNFEAKRPKSATDRWSHANPWKFIVLGQHAWMSELDLQVAYKLLLGSPKDLEDAGHIARVASQALSPPNVQWWTMKLGVAPEVLQAWCRRFQLDW